MIIDDKEARKRGITPIPPPRAPKSDELQPGEMPLPDSAWDAPIYTPMWMRRPLPAKDYTKG